MIYVTADLHGYSFESFMRELQRVGFDRDDELYVLGDVIDRRGDGGVRLLRWMMNQENVFLLRGNHEQMLLSCKVLFEQVDEELLSQLSSEQLQRIYHWMRNGGQPTAESLKKLKREDPEEFADLIDYLQDTPLYEILRVKKKVYLLVHAGLGNYKKGREMDEYLPDELLWTRPELCTRYDSRMKVIFGHTPTLFYGEEYRGRMISTDTWINIDTGAAAGLCPMLLRLQDEKPFYFEPIDE